ncbi:hypothetical protein EI94DRAFT_776704 [Lactarius quietus]|nr:hypothetical protein EI94DRAFT_776704 [Lactarius quietus]
MHPLTRTAGYQPPDLARYPFPLQVILGIAGILGLPSPDSTSLFSRLLVPQSTTAHHEIRQSPSESRERVVGTPAERDMLPTTPIASISHLTLLRYLESCQTPENFVHLLEASFTFCHLHVKLRHIGSKEFICADALCINCIANPAY